ncbi:hypothetical protein GWK47_033182 [Chionoecetes opilio]|uniref:Uncharacterized protein n=1 Tax=Chionoecetes opilio TaxID=41210 RepID=A0A8J4YHE5_CHIOP|nr:hypothetical protein GWK47_033182 [Chionoecetes opilio]
MIKELAETENFLYGLHRNSPHKRPPGCRSANRKLHTIRQDREGRSPGGVAGDVKQALAASVEVLVSFSKGTTEMLAIFIKDLNLVTTVIHGPPNTSVNASQEITTKLCNLLEDPPNECTVFLILGDCNLPHISRPAMNIAGGTPEEKKKRAKRYHEPHLWRSIFYTN